ncbi:hypothetical protein RND71_017147 [Anisodus tanguticus]|uniref:Uncharacterized protein n=1 Tax=Anisodus tanguticus TaxID=243964 RepID=A0AAE1S1T1_9SOLA|nr:hypothetical protein RND71_017147 [Anisodus tanguticus]
MPLARIYEDLMGSFEEINVVYIPRAWNVLARNIAKFSLLLLHTNDYDKVPRDVLWRSLDVRGVHVTYTRAIKDIYEEFKTQNLESKGFKLSRTKAEYLECKFSGVTWEADMKVRLDTRVIPKKESFK